MSFNFRDRFNEFAGKAITQIIFSPTNGTKTQEIISISKQAAATGTIYGLYLYNAYTNLIPGNAPSLWFGSLFLGFIGARSYKMLSEHPIIGSDGHKITGRLIATFNNAQLKKESRRALFYTFLTGVGLYLTGDALDYEPQLNLVSSNLKTIGQFVMGLGLGTLYQNFRYTSITNHRGPKAEL